MHEWLKWRVGFRLFNYDSYKYLVVRNSFGYVAFGTGAILLAWFVPHISDKISESISIGSTGGGVDIIPIAGMSMSGLAFCIGQIDRYVNRDTSLIDSFLGKNVTEVRYRMNNTSMVRSRLFRNSLVALISATFCYVLLRNLSFESQTLPFTPIRLLSLTSSVLLISFVIVFLSVTANVVASFNGYSREDAIGNIADTFARDGLICWSPVSRAAYATASEPRPGYGEYVRSAQRLIEWLSDFKSRREIAVISEVLDPTSARGWMYFEEEERLKRRFQKGQNSARKNDKGNVGGDETSPVEKDPSRSAHMIYHYASLIEASFYELVQGRTKAIPSEWQDLLWELIRVFARRLSGYYASFLTIDEDFKDVCREGLSGSLWSEEMRFALGAHKRVSPASRAAGDFDLILPGWSAIAAVLEMEEHRRDVNLDYFMNDIRLSVFTKLVHRISDDLTKKKLVSVLGCFILRHAEEIFADGNHDYGRGVKGLLSNMEISDDDVSKYCEQELLSERTHTTKYVTYLAQQAGPNSSSFVLLRNLYYSRRSRSWYSFATREGIARALRSLGVTGMIGYLQKAHSDTTAERTLVAEMTLKAKNSAYAISHYVTADEIKWLIQALDRSLDLELVHEFVALRRSHIIHELTILDFVSWHYAASPRHIYYSDEPLVKEVETELKNLERSARGSQGTTIGNAGDTGLDHTQDVRDAIKRALDELARRESGGHSE